MKTVTLSICCALLAISSPAIAKTKVRRFVTPEMQTAQQLPADLMQVLQQQKFSEAMQLLQNSSPTPRTQYLAEQINRILIDTIEGRPHETPEALYFQDLGIAWHNLFLFLLHEKQSAPAYFKAAKKYYAKVRKHGTPLQRAQANVLTAALLVANGDVRRGEKLFAKINPATLNSDFNSHADLASYYAALGNAEQTVVELRAAYRLDPQSVLQWIETGDDFWKIANSKPFQLFMNELQEQALQRSKALATSAKQKAKLKKLTPYKKSQKSKPKRR